MTTKPEAQFCRERELLRRVAELESELQSTRGRLHFLESHSTLATGVAGESLIASLVDGTMTPHNASEDIVVAGLRLEVKMAHLNVAVRGGRNRTKRWAWAAILGHGNTKTFDHLILLGEKECGTAPCSVRILARFLASSVMLRIANDLTTSRRS